MYINKGFLKFLMLRFLTIVLTISALSIPLKAEVDVDLGKKLYKINCASTNTPTNKGPSLYLKMHIVHTLHPNTMQ